MTEPAPSAPQALIDAFIRLAKADFTVRLPRNFKRDYDDTLAFFVNLIAEELDRLTKERERTHQKLEEDVTRLSEHFLAFASGDFSVRAPRTDSGDPLDVLAFLFNNTAAEVEEAFRELRSQRAVVEAILESMLDGVLLLDEGGVVRRANGAMARLLGRDQLEGVPLASLVAEREQDFAARIGELVRAAPFRDRDTLFRVGGGGLVSLAVNGSAQLGASGELAGVVLVARDDRELKNVQAQLQITDRLATMGTVAAGVAHEVNNPLAFITANLEFVDEELAALARGEAFDADRIDELVRAVKSSRTGADRVRQIVRDLKAFSRKDQDVAAPTDLNKLLDAAVSMIRNEVRHHARVQKDYGEVPPVIANEGRLVQVFLNLVQNAAQAIPSGRADANTIRLVTGRTNHGEAFVEIHDTGSGIPEEILPRIFEVFFTTKPAGVGTGLGLAISHNIVRSYGGRIEVASKVGVGTTFRVVLPAAAPAIEPSPVESAPTSLRRRRMRVLVIDDEAEIGDAVRRLLDGEHQIDAVTDAAAGLARLEAAHYDVVLCDLMMPVMTGMELFRRLSEERPDVTGRIVFMTGGVFDTDASRFLDQVTNPRVNKPFDRETLRSLFARISENGGKRAPA
jgi:PAS domain S-box-containing protein